LKGNVHWKSVLKGLDTSIALGILYLIRCSLHAAALKKNVSNLVREEKVVWETTDETHDASADETSSRSPSPSNAHWKRRKFSETLDEETTIKLFSDRYGDDTDDHITTHTQMVAAKPSNLSLKEILFPYGVNQIVGALIGSFGIVPSVAATTTMYSVRGLPIFDVPSISILISFHLFH
jgi:hypothetical protein